MRRHPNGFPRYFDKGDNFSAAAMKHFKKHKLLPSTRHSIYSFRHSFKDQLKAAEAPEELIDELMAHAKAAIRRRLRLEAQAEISSSDRLDAAAA